MNNDQYLFNCGHILDAEDVDRSFGKVRVCSVCGDSLKFKIRTCSKCSDEFLTNKNNNCKKPFCDNCKERAERERRRRSIDAKRKRRIRGYSRETHKKRNRPTSEGRKPSQEELDQRFMKKYFPRIEIPIMARDYPELYRVTQ